MNILRHFHHRYQLGKWTRQVLILLMVGLLTAFCAVSCQSGEPDSAELAIKIGSKEFAEQLIVGEIYATILESQGLPVERKLRLGGTFVTHSSLKSGQIDLYPEYTGTALTVILKKPTTTQPDRVFDIVSQAYKENFNLEWLAPAPMNNSYVLAMTAEKATKLGIETISGLATKAGELVAIGPPEFPGREDGLPGLQKVYGNFQLKSYKTVNAGLRYKGLLDDQGDVVVAFGTDGEIYAFNLVVLEDDKNFFIKYQLAPVVRREVLENYPRIRQILDSVSAKLTNKTLQRLNYQVTGKQREPAEVAKEFLMQEGLI